MVLLVRTIHTNENQQSCDLSKLNNLRMFVFCLTWLTCLSNKNTNTFVVDRKQFSEITNVREHEYVKLFNL